ncbi:piggyBac transposable element-derived protein 4 [Trichonephila clavipes]|nr:piggyBac transposable element-derived protein 4 [Trichonephila clavipes]
MLFVDHQTTTKLQYREQNMTATSGKKKQCVNKREKLSDSNPDELNSGTFVSNDGTGWEIITSGSCSRRRIVEHNIFRDKSGPTSYVKLNIENGYAISSEKLLIDEPMLRHIKNCIEEEDHRQLGKKKSTTIDELDDCISILYVRDIYGAYNLELDTLWSVDWGPPFFCDYMARDRFRELMKLLRLDKKTAPPERFQADNCVSFLKFGRHLLKLR